MKRNPVRSSVLTSCVMAGCLPLGLQAAQLAYEGFDYPGGSSNLTGLNGGSGWNGVWMTANNGSADVVAGSLAAGANAPADYDARSISNSATVPNARRVGRKLDTSAAGPFGSRGYVDANGRIGANGKTLYLSFMQQPNGTSLYYEFEFHRGDLGDPGRIAGIGNDQNGDNVNLRAPNGTHTLIGPGSTSVNFYVVRIDFKDGNDDVYVYQNPVSATEPGTPTLVKLNAADMAFDGISFGAFVNGRTVSHDEVRLGESWSDVTVPPAALPVIASEPRAATTGFAGGSVTLTARADGQPLPTYQWFKGATALAGQTASALTLSNLQASDAGDYHLVATNSLSSATTRTAKVAVTTAPAGLLAYEGFDSDPGTGRLPGSNGGIGWGAPWTQVNGTGGTITSAGLAAGTNAPNGYDNESHGNAAVMPNAQRDGRLLDTSPGGRFGAAGYVDAAGNIGADGKTVYISFLQQPDGLTKFYEFEFHRGNLGDPGRIGGIGNDTGNPVVSLRTGNSQNAIGPAGTGVNFYVVRIDFKEGSDDVTVYQNPVSATEPGTPTLFRPGASDMSFNGLSIAAFDNGRTVRHDEIRVGQSWADVVFGTSRRDLVWAGDGTANAWDFSAPNWTSAAAPTAFIDGDPVTFDDSGSATPAVNVAATVSTSVLNLNNAAKDYRFAGSGKILASGGLRKLGGGALAFTAAADFGSTLTVEGGALALDGVSTTAGNLSLNAGAGNLSLGGTNTFTGSLLDGAVGTRAFSGSNSFSGLVSSSAFTFTGTTRFTGGGSVIWFGSVSGTASITIEPGASIDISGSYNDALVFGRDGGSATVVQNGGTFTYNPSNRGEAFIAASGAALGTTATYEMKGGILDMAAKRLGVGLGGTGAGVTGTLHQTGGEIRVRQLDLGANLSAGTGIFTLEGGKVLIGAGGVTSTSGQATVQLGAGTVAAAADWNSLLAMTLTGPGGATTFDTAGHTIRLSGTLDGEGGLVKTGDGTLVINGSNTFSGPITVNGGTLAGSGSYAETSVVSIAAGGALSPGDEYPGLYACSSAQFAAGATLQVNLSGNAQGSGQLFASGTVNITGANLALAAIDARPVLSGTQLILIDAPGGLTGTFNGLPNNAPLTVGNSTFVLQYTTNNVILTSTTVLSPYFIWADGNGLNGSDGKDPAFPADPDGDGLANGLEWILGGDPLAADGGSLVEVSGTGAGGLTLTFDRAEDSVGNSDLTVEWNTTLAGPWSEIPANQSATLPNGVVVTVDTSATPDRVTVTIPASLANGGKVFARLRATSEP